MRMHLMYANDNDDYVVSLYQSRPWGKHLYLLGYASTYNVIFCPLALYATIDKSLPGKTITSQYCTYGIYNYRSDGSEAYYNSQADRCGKFGVFSNTDGIYYKITKAKAPSGTIILADTFHIGDGNERCGNAYFHPTTIVSKSMIALIHNGNSNTTSLDGHAEAVNQARLRKDDFTKISNGSIQLE